MQDWLSVTRGSAPLLLSMPHTGVQLPDGIERSLISPWRARCDTDWWVDRLYDFAASLDVTIVRTGISRTVIDVNRDPSGASLYPGLATTGLCPTTTFDGEPLYRPDAEPTARDISERTVRYFAPYHAALAAEIARLRALHPAVVLYDCHSIRSRIPRLFAGELPHFNLGTNSGASCSPALAATVTAVCERTPYTLVVDGRFKGGYITRHYGDPARGVHALQMELACRGYLRETPGPIAPQSWPVEYDMAYAISMRTALRSILTGCLRFAAAAA
ncbi:MAG TPA: N-formylglutamate deformylase [Steroidobacteraceae bacterium]|nr:N-formylglutamate deformylase [Steroidobacteraceae bacterium]